MTDKDGREIWENDIVEAWSEGCKARGIVKKRTDGLWIMYPAWKGDDLWIIYPTWQRQKIWGLYPDGKGKTTVKIIGNIFDNPGLLEGDGEG